MYQKLYYLLAFVVATVSFDVQAASDKSVFKVTVDKVETDSPVEFNMGIRYDDWDARMGAFPVEATVERECSANSDSSSCKPVWLGVEVKDGAKKELTWFVRKESKNRHATMPKIFVMTDEYGVPNQTGALDSDPCVQGLIAASTGSHCNKTLTDESVTYHISITKMSADTNTVSKR